jgi:hypothetical protein
MNAVNAGATTMQNAWMTTVAPICIEIAEMPALMTTNAIKGSHV